MFRRFQVVHIGELEEFSVFYKLGSANKQRFFVVEREESSTKVSKLNPSQKRIDSGNLSSLKNDTKVVFLRIIPEKERA